ncbi:MAG: PAS domain-containing protein [Thermoanaerobaculia bacterium]
MLKVANPAAKATGYPLDELLGKSFLDLLHPAEHEMALELYRRRLEGDDEERSLVARVVTAGGATLVQAPDAGRLGRTSGGARLPRRRHGARSGPARGVESNLFRAHRRGGALLPLRLRLRSRPRRLHQPLRPRGTGLLERGGAGPRALSLP